MTTNSTMPTPSSAEGEQFLCDDWFDPLENGVRTRIRGFIEELLEAELDAALGRFERDTRLGDFCKSGVGVRHHLLRSYSISICHAGVRLFCGRISERA